MRWALRAHLNVTWIFGPYSVFLRRPDPLAADSSPNSGRNIGRTYLGFYIALAQESAEAREFVHRALIVILIHSPGAEFDHTGGPRLVEVALHISGRVSVQFVLKSVAVHFSGVSNLRTSVLRCFLHLHLGSEKTAQHLVSCVSWRSYVVEMPVLALFLPLLFLKK